jgi:hypothetical protein
MKESDSFHHVSIKGCKICSTVDQQPFSMSVAMHHLHNNRYKQVHFMYSHVRQWGGTFVKHAQVLTVLPICLFYQQLDTFHKEEHENTEWGSVYSYMQFLV